jgi:hypothetical protein
MKVILVVICEFLQLCHVHQHINIPINDVKIYTSSCFIDNNRRECILVQHDRLLRYGMDMVSNIEINGMSGYRQTIIKTNNIHG